MSVNDLSVPQGTLWQRIVRHACFQDWVSTAFHTYMLSRAALGTGPGHETATQICLLLLGITVITIILCRGEILQGKTRAMVYRIGLFVPVMCSYFSLRWLLPGIGQPMIDEQLLSIDRAIFGETPAVVLANYNYRGVIEWFGFFYYGYFWLMAAMLLPTLFFDKDRRQAELLVGALLVAALGHSGYTLVPGVGPHAHMEFAEPINGGFFWAQILETIEAAGAHMDIFPSLHTAYPMMFAFHATRWRKTKPFKYVWFLVVIAALHMLVATMLLRWHWGIDVVAGLMVAIFANRMSVRVADVESNRTESGRQGVFERFRRAEDEANAAA